MPHPIAERVSKRLDAILQRPGRVAEDPRFVPHDHAFDQVFHVVVDDRLNQSVAVREVVVDELTSDVRFLRDGGRLRPLSTRRVCAL